jgi:O-antigen ligase
MTAGVAVRVLSRAAFAGLWAFVFALPWDVITLPFGGSSVPRIVGLVAAALAIAYIFARRSIRPLGWFHVLAILSLVWTGASSLWSIDPEATRQRFMTYAQLLVFVWLLWEIAPTAARQRTLLQAYVGGASVAAAATIKSYLSGVAVLNEWSVATSRFVAFGQDPNELGVMLALGLPMAWYLSLTEPRRGVAWLWRAYLPLGITGILLTASRGAALAGLVGLAIIPWTLGRMRPLTKVALSALVLASLAVGSRFVPKDSLKRIESTRSDIAAGYFGGRVYIWSAGLEAVRERPVSGAGAGAFGAAVAPVLHREMASHQTFLEILVEQGLVGLVLFFALVVSVVRPLPRVPMLERRLWIILLLSLAVGSMSLHLGFRKQFWFVLGLLATQMAKPRRRTSEAAYRPRHLVPPGQ